MNTQVSTQKVNARSSYYSALIYSLHLILGSLLLAICSQVAVPIGPIPVTLQTFALFSLALFQGSRKAFFSACLYLVQASIGLPVLANWGVNPLWITGLSGGYLVAFPIAAYVIGKLAERKSAVSFWHLVFSVGVGQSIIYTLGVSFLAFHLGFLSALSHGLLPFLWMAALKSICAASLRKGFFRMFSS